MVYISSWQEYQEAAEALYDKSPNTTRYCVKWRASEGKLVLKITDNTTCLKFKTYSSIFLNRFEALNLSLMQKMQSRRPKPTAGPSTPAQPEPTEGISKDTASPAAAPTSTGVAGGGGVKKKKPKKKK
ncbi:signal recognition particle SRP9/SRP14 subunit [Wolfiporia cocos MD-104 SS10]|uniref:Signal recognition particle SRP9/SRP14 subunit n=1 Tax=Wolfiporia cocos (strain MD-104) TaxID=742152 RepID=A0A2H3JVN1_WOLCO|nr:signal recognition particle SRP9/SRP14 subunit [Wolfiporia cocos MD-104 SS10]